MCISYDAVLHYPGSRLSYLRRQPATLNPNERVSSLHTPMYILLETNYYANTPVTN